METKKESTSSKVTSSKATSSKATSSKATSSKAIASMVAAPKAEKEKCGIIMPISAIDGLPEQHWLEVKEIHSDAIMAANYDANLVSNADDIGIIQKTIIQNLYDNPIVVCDVSGKNPNVMFELGMRLAFDKPTIIVKDDKTTYSFDTSPIEHLTYPRDLRFSKIVEFKKELSEKIIATVKKSKADKNFSTFLKHFGKFTVAKLETTEVSKEEFIAEELREMKISIQRLAMRDSTVRQRFTINDKNDSVFLDDYIYAFLNSYLINFEPAEWKKVLGMSNRYFLYNKVLSKIKADGLKIDTDDVGSRVDSAIDNINSTKNYYNVIKSYGL